MAEHDKTALRMSLKETVEVGLGQRRYPIDIGAGLLASAGKRIAELLGRRRLFIVADASLDAAGHRHVLNDSLIGAGHDAVWLEITGGEGAKSFLRFEHLLEDMLAAGADRRCVVVAFGGGVVGDLAGFAAATLLRGVDFVQVPTTLLAQVDSSVGGKTGINSARHGKNLIGAFHQPQLVLIDTDVLHSLPRRELLAGYAEVIKYGCILDRALFDWLEAHGEALIAGDAAARTHAIKRSVEIKAQIVEEDERETSGRRALLNFGHTFAHAFEALSGYGGVVLHGEAVSVGMVCAARLSVRHGVAGDDDVSRLERHLRILGLPTASRQLRNEAYSPRELLEVMRRDKKAQAGALRFVLWRGIGEAYLDGSVAEDDVLALLSSDG